MSNGLADVVLGADILSATGFKPWWETLRAYLVLGLIIISIVIIYTMKPTTSLVCLPNGNATEFDKIGHADVNVHCAKFAPGSWFFLNVGYFALALAITIHLLYSWWLLVPRVRYSFKSMRDYDDTIKRLSETVEDFYQFFDKIIPPGASNKEKKEIIKANETAQETRSKVELIQDKIRKIITEMNDFDPGVQIAVPTLYIIRNVLAVIAICGNIYVLYFVTHKVQQVPYNCTVEAVSATCRYDVIDQLKPFVFCAMGLLTLAGMISFFAVFETVINLRSLPKKLQCLQRQKDYALVIGFGRHSTALSQSADGLLRKAVENVEDKVPIAADESTETQPLVQ